MTDEELRTLVAETRVEMADNSRAIRELREESNRLREESKQLRENSNRQWEKSWEETKQLRRESDRLRRESNRRWAESNRRWEESDRLRNELREELRQLREDSNRQWEQLWEEIRASRREADRILTSFNRQLGRIGNRFGDYTESLFRPSLKRVMREQFKMTVITSPQRIERHGEELEIDLLAHAGDVLDEVYLVEIKSRLREHSIDQLHDQLRQFPRFFPEHRGKKLFGVLAALDIPPDMRARVLKQGFYLATITDDVLEIITPDDFVPRTFGLRGLN